VRISENKLFLLSAPTIYTETRADLKSAPDLKPAVQVPIAKKTAALAADTAGGRIEFSVTLIAFRLDNKVHQRRFNPERLISAGL